MYKWEWTRANDIKSTWTRANDTWARANDIVICIFGHLMRNDREWTWNIIHCCLWPISPILICHSWMFIEQDFLKQPNPVNLHYHPILSHLIPLISSWMAILLMLIVSVSLWELCQRRGKIWRNILPQTSTDFFRYVVL
jgi:hypothetical protein